MRVGGAVVEEEHFGEVKTLEIVARLGVGQLAQVGEGVVEALGVAGEAAVGGLEAEAPHRAMLDSVWTGRSASSFQSPASNSMASASSGFSALSAASRAAARSPLAW